jgi:hypothetical protein
MKIRTTFLLTFALLLMILASCVASEYLWATKESKPDNVRQLIGLPSVVVGNLSPAARNPGLEVLCSALNDVPGGYCNYFAGGAPVANASEITRNRVSAP